MRLDGFPKLALNIIRKDWAEYYKPVLGIAGGSALAALMTAVSSSGSSFAKGALIGAGLGGAYGFAQSCFFHERQRGTLMLLISLPVTPAELVLAKFISAFSMTLFTINVPGVLLRDYAFLFYSNVGALFLTTVCMSATVISDKPWAPQLPLWILMMVVFPARPILSHFHTSLPETIRWILVYRVWIALVMLVLICLILYASARLFDRQVSA
jgi:hypothetical protein